MRLAGRLAAEVLDLTPHIRPGVATAEIDKLAHDYMVVVQGSIPATLNYAPPGHAPYPASLCTRRCPCIALNRQPRFGASRRRAAATSMSARCAKSASWSSPMRPTAK